jgi:predicted RNA binding protein YcfA (HicA-like mRNA interferase family)
MKPVSGRRFARALRRKGWTLDRTRGSHHVFRSPDGSKVVTVPVHNRDMRHGLQASLMKDSGLTDDDL